MRLAELAGEFQYLKGKSSIFTEAVRSWVTPAAATGGLAKYLGLQSRWAIVVAIAIPLLVEVFGYMLGRFLYKHGGVEKEYQLALDRDPYKRQSLALAHQYVEESKKLRIAAVAILSHLSRKTAPPA